MSSVFGGVAVAFFLEGMFCVGFCFLCCADAAAAAYGVVVELLEVPAFLYHLL